ncbi:MAG: DUF1570 domain-containing protein [Planctomycetota bacterium]|nr:DUF1570 domain-containing protein [Planctomycetota bacterium]MDA1214096.1 DUF1570 domain-containing protein [Planctomycetota bacterium]
MSFLCATLSFRISSVGTVLALFFLVPIPLHGDEFTYFDAEGDTQTVQARLAGSAQGFFALELADGQILLVAEGNVKTRVAGDDPEPLDAEDVNQNLVQMFGGEEYVISYVDTSHVLVYIPHRPIDDKREKSRKLTLLKHSARYLNSMERKFSEHVKYNRLDDHPFRFPLVTIIFETDDDFEEYTRKVTSNNTGLSAGAIAAFYDALTNYLVLRESECATFEVPLHESIHQQVFNREILQRMAPVPVWFHEGIANAFEGDGKTIKRGPRAVNEKYCQQSLAAQQVTWDDMVRNDRAFQSDSTAGDAYGHAWGLHWLMVNNYRDEYSLYVKYLAQLTPLEVVDETERVEQFEKIMKTSVDKLHDEFLQKIRAALKKLNRNGTSFQRNLHDIPNTVTPKSIFTRGTQLSVGGRTDLTHTIFSSLRSGSGSPSVNVRTSRDHHLEPSENRSGISRWLKPGIDFSVPVEQRWQVKQ